MANGTNEQRRDFLRRLVRGALLAGLLGGTAALTARDRETCTNRGICRGCAAYDDCGLPQALSAKQAGKSEETWRTTK